MLINGLHISCLLVNRILMLLKENGWNSRKKPSQTLHCNSLNSSFLAVKLKLTLKDKGVLMLQA